MFKALHGARVTIRTTNAEISCHSNIRYKKHIAINYQTTNYNFSRYSTSMDLPTIDTTDTKYETKICHIQDIEHFQDEQLSEAIKYLRAGEAIAFPTETVYGLGANAYSSSAVEKIFKAKGRPSDNPLIVHIASIKMLKDLVAEEAFPKEGSTLYKLCTKFWPGPLTILFKRSTLVPSNVTAGLDFVGVRMPSHPVARKLIELANLPLAAPSANRSGKPSPTIAEHVIQDLNGRVPYIIDGGSARFGVESTVIDLNRDPPLVLRPGGVTLEQLRELVPNVQLYEKEVHGSQLAEQPPTPGLKYRHYSPTAKVILFEESGSMGLDGMKESLIARLNAELKAGKRVAIIHTQSAIDYSFLKKDEYRQVIFYPLGDEHHPELVAQGIFKALRDLDMQGVDYILIEGISEHKEGLAVMNRIRKAASEVIKQDVS